MNLADFKKAEIIKMWNFRCIHGHRGTEHTNCYLDEKKVKERVGYLDIETFSFGFKAQQGVIMTYCIKEEGVDEKDGGLITNIIMPHELQDEENRDKRIVRELCADIRKFDRIITFYGKRFDVPFIRTRALYYHIDFPGYMALTHTDVYDTIKRKFSLRGNSLGNTCKFFGIEAKGHMFGFPVWASAFQGDVEALKNILEHNKEDVICLEVLWGKVREQVREVASSI